MDTVVPKLQLNISQNITRSGTEPFSTHWDSNGTSEGVTRSWRLLQNQSVMGSSWPRRLVFIKQVTVRIKVSEASHALRDDYTMGGPSPNGISEESRHLVMPARWLESKMLCVSLRGREESSASSTTWHREAQGRRGWRKGRHGADPIIKDVSRRTITMLA